MRYARTPLLGYREVGASYTAELNGSVRPGSYLHTLVLTLWRWRYEWEWLR
jgi:hypothetical protein